VAAASRSLSTLWPFQGLPPFKNAWSGSGYSHPEEDFFRVVFLQGKVDNLFRRKFLSKKKTRIVVLTVMLLSELALI
jgi:hypothetical protein